MKEKNPNSQTNAHRSLKGEEKDEQKGVIFRVFLFGCCFPAEQAVAQHHWGCCSAFAALLPASRPDTTKHITPLTSNSSSMCPGRGPDPARCPQELAAPSLEKQRQPSTGAGQGLPARRLSESQGTPTQWEPGEKQGPGMKRHLHEAARQRTQEKSASQPLDVNSLHGS